MSQLAPVTWVAFDAATDRPLVGDVFAPGGEVRAELEKLGQGKRLLWSPGRLVVGEGLIQEPQRTGLVAESALIAARYIPMVSNILEFAFGSGWKHLGLRIDPIGNIESSFAIKASAARFLFDGFKVTPMPSAVRGNLVGP